MSFFSGETKVYVASVVYNLAGPIMDRPDFKKTTVTGAIITNAKSISDSLGGAYLTGPGIKLRSFGRWARNSGYSDLVAQAEGALTLVQDVDFAVLTGAIPIDPGESLHVQSAVIAGADYMYWVEQWLLENAPDALETDYDAILNEDTGEITITFVDTSSVTIPATGFDRAGQYLYASYTRIQGEAVGTLIPGSPVVLGEFEPWPDTTGWTLVSNTGTVQVYERLRLMGRGSGEDYNQVLGLKEIMTFTTNPGPPEVRAYQVDTQDVVLATYLPLQLFIYKKGSGNPTLDSLFVSEVSKGRFLPFIPVRVKNTFVSPSYLGDIYPMAKKALKKATGGSFDEIVEKVSKNESLGDIDYAFIVFGVSLNTPDNSAKRYLYEFFQEIMRNQDLAGAGMAAWRAAQAVAEAQAEAWRAWWEAQNDPMDPLYGAEVPDLPTVPPLPTYRMQIASLRPEIGYDMTVSWTGIEEVTGTGQLKPGAKTGELWWEVQPAEPYQEEYHFGFEDLSFANVLKHVERARLCWQVSANEWRYLDIYGLHHRNYIYGGKSVDIGAGEALVDPEESGFIIPLHEDIYKRLPLTHATQMATSCCYLVFNCYKEVKAKWYQTGFFRVILVVVAIVIAVVSWGWGSGFSAGLLGANASVGAALGFTGTAAVIAGAVANAIAAILVTQLISYVSTALFGEQIGAIIGVIASIITIQVGTALANGGSMATAFGDLMKAENILKLTDAAGKGYAAYIEGNVQDIAQRTQEAVQDYSRQAEEISRLYEQNFTATGLSLNPLAFTDVAVPLGEPPASFLGRTLMTGSDVAEMSLNMLSNFAEITLSTDLPVGTA